MAVVDAPKRRTRIQRCKFLGGNMGEKDKSSKISVSLALAIALSALPCAPARAQDTVKLGDLAAISNAAIYIAVEKGFFKEQGIVTDITNFASAAKQVPALVAGELEVSVGSASLARPKSASLA